MGQRRMVVAALVAALVATAAGCGNDERATGTTPAAAAKVAPGTKGTLVLDFVPNAVHSGVYRALADGRYAKRGVDLRVVQPTSTADTLKLIDAGRADVGLADPIDVAGQVARGRPAVIVGGIVQRPLGGVIVLDRSGIARAAQLEGRTVGITGVPSDEAVLDTVIRHDGGDPAKVRRVTIGFNGVQQLEGGKIDGFTGFWPADMPQVEHDGKPAHAFRLDAAGPRWPGLVAFTTRKRLREEPALIRSMLAATVQGYRDTLASPAKSLDALIAANRALDRGLAQAQLDQYLPLFAAGGPVGRVPPAAIGQLTTFMTKEGLAKAPLRPATLATEAYLPPSAR
jgi:NitT/TauT family transport system substrate-binding protein/putative hydroxymethylpyrimidine transport system substrate-binding protein